jgi:putative tricarboxylic transport membrane protein
MGTRWPAKGEQDPIWVLRLLFLPLILAFVLGPLLENNLRKSLIMSQGDFSIFFLRPLSAASLILALFLPVSPLIPWMGKRRREIPKEEVS